MSRWRRWWGSLTGLETDALLYLAAAAFCIALGATSDNFAQAHWAWLALPTYLLGAGVAWWRRYSNDRVRRILAAVVVVGAALLPLALEIHWRSQGDARYAEPEVSVIERSGGEVAKGQNPYPTYYHNGHLVHVVSGHPAWESFFPYFPLMAVFGLPHAATHVSRGLTDARIVLSLFTLLVALAAIRLFPTSTAHRIRLAQFLLALPTGALFLATGGDDMPILALLLLGLAGWRRQSWWMSGVAFGIAAAMKLTAWPLVGGLLMVAVLQRSVLGKRVALVVAGVCVATVAPFAWRAPRGFFTNVVSFPLGLAHVESPAATPLPGYVLVHTFPVLRHVLAPTVFVIGGWWLWRFARRHWPLRDAAVLRVAGGVMATAMTFATATRSGYVIYPINFFLWAAILA